MPETRPPGSTRALGRAFSLRLGLWYALLFLVYVALLMSSVGYGLPVFCLLGLGGYFAATEGVLAAIAGALLPEDLQASGLGMLTTVVSIGNLLSSLVFGALWLELGLHNAVLVFGAGLALAIVVAVPLLLRSQRTPVHA